MVPLLIFDTNILVDVLLRRDGEHAALLVKLAEQLRVELVVPEYVLLEFRGIALRWIGQERERVIQVRRVANAWARCGDLGEAAEEMKGSVAHVEAQLSQFTEQIDVVIRQVERVARVPTHTVAAHFRGELRGISLGDPQITPTKACRTVGSTRRSSTSPGSKQPSLDGRSS